MPELWKLDASWKTGVKVASIFLVASTFWIVGSDYLVANVAPTKLLLTTFQTYKGLFYTAVMAVLICVAVTRSFRRERNDLIAMREREERLRILFEDAPDAIYVVDEQGRFIDGNRRAEILTGYGREELIGKDIITAGLLEPSEFRKATDGVERIRAGQTTGPDEFTLKRKDGAEIIVEIRSFPAEVAGQRIGLGVARDVTERKEVEEKLQDSERKLHAIFDHHFQLTGLLDQQGRILAANKTALDFAGVDEAAVMGAAFWESPWWTPSTRSDIHDAVQRAGKGEFVRFESQHIRADGELRDFDFSLSPVKDDEGNVIYLVPEGRDITEMRRAEDLIRERESMIRAIVETTRDWIWAVDLNGNHRYCSPAVETMLGLSIKELSDSPHFESVCQDDRSIVEKNFTACVEAKTGWDGLVVRWEHKDGSTRFLESNAVPVLDPEGNLLGFRGVDRDITERVKSDEKMAEMEARLTHVARLSAMGEMIAGVAHEVAQPLHAIVNYSGAIKNFLAPERELNLDDVRECNAAIADSAKLATDVVRRMRAFARRGESLHAPCSINKIVHEAVQLVAFDARRKNAVVLLELPDAAPQVEADRVQIQQVLVNLLHNAFEAMEESVSENRQVAIRCELQGGFTRVTVSDTGPGIPSPKDLDVFEPFATNKRQGLGLGLAISTSIVESHGGRLWADADAKGGATFRFTLPSSETEVADDH